MAPNNGYYSDRDFSTEEEEEDDYCDTFSEYEHKSTHPRPSYTVLTEADLQVRQEEDIQLVSSTLSLPISQATLLLTQLNWNIDIVYETWFSNQFSVNADIGLVEQPSNSDPVTGEIICQICFDTHQRDRMSAAACGHNYCADCWAGYIACSINDGPGCLSLRCPHPTCRVAIDQTMINKLANKEDRSKYSGFLLRSYVEGRNTMSIKWCPSPGCQYAIEFTGGDHYDVECMCSYRFCWCCTQEAHRPAKCDMVAKWMAKNNSDGGNTNWLLENSKPCPKCKRPIDKDQGCMHMRCTPPCRYEFCWLCLGDWYEHGKKTGGFYSCKLFEQAKKEGNYKEDEMKMMNARGSLFRYTHYYERWISHHTSMVKALESLRELENGGLTDLSNKLHGETEEGLKFMIEAWKQIVECMRVLKWSYAYGYFIPEHQRTKIVLFEEFRGQAELGLERLHQYTEEELRHYITDEEKVKHIVAPFQNFKTRLIDLIVVTEKHFENLVQAFEGGLQEVISEIDDMDSFSSVTFDDDMSQTDHWFCNICNFANSMDSTRCVMCEAPEDPHVEEVHNAYNEYFTEEVFVPFVDNGDVGWQ